MSSPPSRPPPRRIGIVGYGALGQFLVSRIAEEPSLELAFVWNRSPGVVQSCPRVPPAAVCRELSAAASFRPDLIVEVCHPAVLREHGAALLAVADLYMGSPTAFADAGVEAALRAAAAAGPHGLYVPCGALWGAADLARMADRGSLAALSVTMKKHPASLKLGGPLGDAVAALLAAGAPAGETVLYAGPVRGLCPLAPNNVNTMATAAIAAHSLGFDGVAATLIADGALDAHVIIVDARGAPPTDGGPTFRVISERSNPAPPGAITGAATFVSFFSSLLAARGRGAGVHLC